MKFKQQGLVSDLMPNIRLMQISGHFMFNYYADGMKFMHKIYCVVSTVELFSFTSFLICFLQRFFENSTRSGPPVFDSSPIRLVSRKYGHGERRR